MRWLKADIAYALGATAPSSLESSRATPQCIARQRALQRVRLCPTAPASHVTLFLRRQDQRHGPWDESAQRSRSAPSSEARRRDRDQVPVLIWCHGRPELDPDAGEDEKRPISLSTNHTPSFFLVFGVAPVKLRPRKIRVSKTVVVAAPARSGKGSPRIDGTR